MKRFFKCLMVLIVFLPVVLLCACKESTYKLNFMINGSVYHTIESSGNETITLPEEPTKDGYLFDGWYFDADYLNELTADTYKEKEISHDVNVYAKWLVVDYTITYHLDGGVNGNNPTSYKVTDNTITLEPAEKLGYTFEGWYTEPTFENKIETIASGSTGDIVLYAKHSVNNYTINFNSNNGSLVQPITQAYGSTVTKPENPVRAGYSFDGWFLDDNTFETEYVFNKMPINGNTLYAKWSTIDYNITYYLDGGNNNIKNPSNYNIESNNILLEYPTKENYNFLGWFTDSSFENPVVQIESGALRDFDIYAKWISNDILFGFNDGTITELNVDKESLNMLVIPTHICGVEIKEISSSVFVDYTNLKSIYYLGTIEEWLSISFAGYGSNPLINGADLYINNQKLENLVIPKSITSIGAYTFHGCASLKNVSFEQDSEVVNIATSAFEQCENLQSVDFDACSKLITIGSAVFSRCTNLESVLFSDSITRIESWAFSDCTSIKSIFIPKSVVVICSLAFLNCSNLETVNFEENSNLSSIEDGAFRECIGLKKIDLKPCTTLTSVNGFYECASLEEVLLPNSIKIIKVHAFTGTKLKSINLEECPQLTEINSFGESEELRTLTIPNTVTKFGCSFEGCENLKSIYYLGTIEEWLSISFAGYGSNPLINGADLYINNQKLENLVIPKSITSIGAYTFHGCASLKNVSFEQGTQLTSIGKNAFSGCTNLKSIDLPNSITSMEEQVFSSCNNIENILIPNSIQNIGKYAFMGCSKLNTVIFERNSQLTTITEQMFYHCAIGSIRIPKSVTKIEFEVLGYCSQLNAVFYEGTEEDWNNIVINDNNDYLLYTKRFYYSEIQPTEEGNFWRYVNDQPVAW